MNTSNTSIIVNTNYCLIFLCLLLYPACRNSLTLSDLTERRTIIDFFRSMRNGIEMLETDLAAGLSRLIQLVLYTRSFYDS